MPRRSGPPVRVRIIKPCAADWDSMVGNDRVRFCAHCNLNVRDLSAMSGAEARRLLRKLEGRLCVRHLRPPETPTRAPAPPRLHQITRRASKVAAGAFGAVLTLCAGAAAQTNTRAGAEPQYAFEPARREGAALTGTVFDAHGAAVAGAKVLAYNVDRWQERSARTDAGGVYRFDSLPPGTYTLTAAAQGFRENRLDNVELLWGLEQTLDARLEVQGPDEVLEVSATQDVIVMGGAAVVVPTHPLVLAAYQDDLPAVRRLLAGGADANTVDEAVGSTALMEATDNGDAEMVLALLAAGADVNLRGESGRTALTSLSDETTAEAVRALLAAGALVNLWDSDGVTALMRAAELEKGDVLRLLLGAGAQLDAADALGRTALMAAAYDGKPENVRALLAAGADWARRDEDGATALKLAREAGHGEVVRLLLAHGARED